MARMSENPRVGGSIPPLGTIILPLLSSRAKRGRSDTGRYRLRSQGKPSYIRSPAIHQIPCLESNSIFVGGSIIRVILDPHPTGSLCSCEIRSRRICPPLGTILIPPRFPKKLLSRISYLESNSIFVGG